MNARILALTLLFVALPFANGCADERDPAPSEAQTTLPVETTTPDGTPLPSGAPDGDGTPLPSAQPGVSTQMKKGDNCCTEVSPEGDCIAFGLCGDMP